MPPHQRGVPATGRFARSRFHVLNSLVDFGLVGLTGGQLKVWLILFRDTKANTGTARSGQADIARRAGLSVRGVQKIVSQLQQKGLLKVVRRGRLNVGPSAYRVFPAASA
jgi:DNA-binding MarR family transcriptional regulator